MEDDFRGKRVLVCGAARSGIAAAKLLIAKGASVTVQDLKKSGLEKEGRLLEEMGASLYFGKNPDDIVADFDLIVVSPGIPVNLPFFEKAAKLGTELYGEVELAYRLSKGRTVAVTGTNGKTTTSSIIYGIFKAFDSKTELAGNIGIPYCEKAGMDLNYTVAEISSFQLETVKTFHPETAVVTNITPDHLNRHKTMENYIEIKERIFKNQTSEDFLILNYDDKICRDMAKKANSQVMFFSRTEKLVNGVCLNGKEIVYARNGNFEKIINISDLNIFGNHSIENVMAASAAAICGGVGQKIIAGALSEFQAVEHRIEYVSTIKGVEYYNDSKATNTDSAIKALQAMTKPVLLIAGGHDKSADFSDLVKLFEEKVKFVALIGETSEQIMETCRAFNYFNAEKANSLKSAVELCHLRAVPGDAVLLSPACASWDMFDNFEQRGKMFKTFVLELTPAHNII